MQSPLRLTALSIFAIALGHHTALADQCDDTIKAWDKKAVSHIDESLDRLSAILKKDQAEQPPLMCLFHKWELASWDRQLSELKPIEVTCGPGKKASYGVPDIEKIQATIRKEAARESCK